MTDGAPEAPLSAAEFTNALTRRILRFKKRGDGLRRLCTPGASSTLPSTFRFPSKPRAAGVTENRYIGKPLHRIEDAPLLRGSGRFVDDLQFPGTLEAAF